jgi:hypothetical protein
MLGYDGGGRSSNLSEDLEQDSSMVPQRDKAVEPDWLVANMALVHGD